MVEGVQQGPVLVETFFSCAPQTQRSALPHDPAGSYSRPWMTLNHPLSWCCDLLGSSNGLDPRSDRGSHDCESL